jgi:hypothetical protein
MTRESEKNLPPPPPPRVPRKGFPAGKESGLLVEHLVVLRAMIPPFISIMKPQKEPTIYPARIPSAPPARARSRSSSLSLLGAPRVRSSGFWVVHLRGYPR